MYVCARARAPREAENKPKRDATRQTTAIIGGYIIRNQDTADTGAHRRIVADIVLVYQFTRTRGESLCIQVECRGCARCACRVR